MSMQRFVAPNHREAMRQVRATLGDDAIIVTSRAHNDGAEVFALRDTDLDTIAEQQSAPTADSEINQRLLADMQDLRRMVEQQSQVQTTQTPLAASAAEGQQWCYDKLRTCGFTDTLARQLMASFPARLRGTEAQQEQPLAQRKAAWQQWLTAQLAQQLQAQQGQQALLEHRGVLALVGPTGVGKTTTTAKLAAHYVMQHGPQSLLLVTTDGYRIGAQQQLATYAELLGVQMHVLDDDEDRSILQQKLQGKQLVLIDTVGMSQRDQRLTDRIASLAAPEFATSPRLLLLLNAASQQATLEEVASNYQSIAAGLGWRIHDCMLTKLDEATSLAPALDSVLRYGFTLQACAMGQRVPEDVDFSFSVESLCQQALTLDPEPRRAVDTTNDGAQMMRQMQHMGSLIQGLKRCLPELAQLPESAVVEEVQQAPAAMFWSAAKTTAAWRHKMPQVMLNEALQPCGAPLAQDHAEQLAVLRQSRLHLFDYLPSAELLASIDHDSRWLAKLNVQQRLAGSAGQSVAKFVEQHGIPLDQWQVMYRGEARQVKLAIAALNDERSGDVHQLLQLRLTSGRAKGSGRTRYYLAHPHCSAAQVQRYCSAMLQLEELPRLTRKAWSMLQQDVLVSAQLAMSASYLQAQHATEAVHFTRQLMTFGQRSGRIEADKLMPLLWQVLQAYRGLQQMQQEELL